MWTPRQRKYSTSLAFWVVTPTTPRMNCECRQIPPTGVSCFLFLDPIPSFLLYITRLVHFLYYSSIKFYEEIIFFCGPTSLYIFLHVFYAWNLRSNGGRRSFCSVSLARERLFSQVHSPYGVNIQNKLGIRQYLLVLFDCLALLYSARIRLRLSIRARFLMQSFPCLLKFLPCRRCHLIC